MAVTHEQILNWLAWLHEPYDEEKTVHKRQEAGHEVDLRARQRMEKSGETYSAAVKAVLAEDESLSKNYIFGGE